MTDKPIAPQFTDVALDEPIASSPAAAPPKPLTRAPRPAPHPVEAARPAEKRKRFLATLDTYLVIDLGILLAVGLMMVYSTTFDWSYQAYGNESTIFFQQVRNMIIGGLVMLLITAIDYRRWKRFAVLFLLVAISSLAAVLLFGDETFGARRALFKGSYQPSEMAELVTIIYMAAWLGSKSTRIRSITYGLIPFSVLVGIVGGLVLLQPDLSTAAVIFSVSATMFFLAGADILQLGLVGLIAGGVVLALGEKLSYAQSRLSSYLAGASDLTQANYHVQQAVIAFRNGGWTGVGLGEGKQKFGFLPAPHTDSIFAVIGEELGVLGAVLVLLLFVFLVIRGYQISRRAGDPFGALLASGITTWVAVKALLNIAVMTAVVPATGVPLPFISYGGSSLVVMMAGMGLLLSVARVTARESSPEWRAKNAPDDRSRRDGRRTLPLIGRRRSDS